MNGFLFTLNAKTGKLKWSFYTVPGPGADERQLAAGRLPAEREAA